MTQQALGDTEKKAKAAVYRLLKIRQRSEKELRDKLKKKKFSRAVIDGAIAYFTRIHLINDRQFTRMWITSRLARPFGFNRIRFELKSKGISDEVIKEEWTEATYDYLEFDAVEKLARRRLAKYKDLALRKARNRLRGYLSRRGFSVSLIRKVIEQL